MAVDRLSPARHSVSDMGPVEPRRAALSGESSLSVSTWKNTGETSLKSDVRKTRPLVFGRCVADECDPSETMLWKTRPAHVKHY